MVAKNSIDYVIASYLLFPHIVEFKICMLDQCLSDTHCLVSVTFKSCMVKEAPTWKPQSMLNGTVHDTYFMNSDTDSGQRYKKMLWV